MSLAVRLGHSFLSFSSTRSLNLLSVSQTNTNTNTKKLFFTPLSPLILVISVSNSSLVMKRKSSSMISPPPPPPSSSAFVPSLYPLYSAPIPAISTILPVQARMSSCIAQASRFLHSHLTSSFLTNSIHNVCVFPRPLSHHHHHLLYRWLSNQEQQSQSSKPLRMLGTPNLDYKYIQENLDAILKNCDNRKANQADPRAVVALYEEYRTLLYKSDQIKQKRNENSKMMKNVKNMSQDEKDKVIHEGKDIKDEMASTDAKLNEVKEHLLFEALKIPNDTHPDVPIGPEANAAVLKIVGKKIERVNQKDHLSLGQALDLFDFEMAAKVAGNKFYYLRNAAALLELALLNWAMFEVMKRGFTPMTTPDVAKDEIVAGCGFQPRPRTITDPQQQLKEQQDTVASQIYKIRNSELCLIGTAEIPLGGYYADEIIDKAQLPIKMVAVSHCFRQEAGSAGAQTRGLYRVHQFTKVEMFVISTPEQSLQLHEELLQIEQELFSSLGLHFKVLDMPTEDLGNPAYRKYDIEAWMPGRGSYGEISSTSNCTDYQARRLNIRYREAQGDNRFVHTLNGTACAVPRLILAILENFHQDDGSVIVPEVLRPYMGGMNVIRPPGQSATSSADGA